MVKKTAADILRKKGRNRHPGRYLSTTAIVALAGMIAGLEAYALYLGLDGIFFSLVIGVIGLLGGVKASDLWNGRKQQ